MDTCGDCKSFEPKQLVGICSISHGVTRSTWHCTVAFEPGPKPLAEELAEALGATMELCNRADDADIGPDCCADYDDVMKRNVAVLLRYEKEQADAEVR